MIVHRVEHNRRRLRVLVHVCETFAERARGLLLRSRPGPETAYLLSPCGRIHTFGMFFPIDVLFCDADDRIIDLVEALRPWRTAGHVSARRVWELPLGSIRTLGLQLGDRINPC
jgi:uncharacterized membrane protein (UPF0127 family)